MWPIPSCWGSRRDSLAAINSKWQMLYWASNFGTRVWSHPPCSVFEIFPVSSVLDWQRSSYLLDWSSFPDLTTFSPAKSLAASALPHTCTCLGHLPKFFQLGFFSGFYVGPVSTALMFSDTAAFLQLCRDWQWVVQSYAAFRVLGASCVMRWEQRNFSDENLYRCYKRHQLD